MNYSSQTLDGFASRLCRPMCGKALPFRNSFHLGFEAMPRLMRARRSLTGSINGMTERRSLSAHQAAQPRKSDSEFVLSSEATKRV
jgi:hypothetical protein